jgi:hypothetical protein
VVLVTVQRSASTYNFTRPRVPAPLDEPLSPMHTGLHQNFLSHILQPSPMLQIKIRLMTRMACPHQQINLSPHHYPATPNSLQHRRYTNSNRWITISSLDFALAFLIQLSGILADGVTPQVRVTLKAINALVSMETPTYDPLPFKSVRNVTKWSQIPRSLE